MLDAKATRNSLCRGSGSVEMRGMAAIASLANSGNCSSREAGAFFFS